MFKVFYSWQSDLPNNTNRGFIEKGLQHACSDLKTTQGAAVEAVVDRDTLGASGAPDIKEMILAKIADSDAFVADISIVNLPTEGSGSVRLSPNPNVLIETGYALSCLGSEALILVCNSHFGAIENLPFDVRGMRLLPYNLKPGAEKKSEAAKLQSALGAAIKAVAAVVRSDPVYSQLFEFSVRMAGQVGGMINDLRKIASEPALEAPLEITNEELLAACRSIHMSAQFPLLIGGLPQQGGRYATVIEGLKHWRERGKGNFQRLMVFSPALKADHLVLAAAVEHSSFYSFLDQFPPNATGGTLEFLAPLLFSQIQAARKLNQYADKYLARRAGKL